MRLPDGTRASPLLDLLMGGIRLLDHLLQVEGDAQYGDLMERTIHNTLFAAQSPAGRQLRYYTAFEGERIYFKRDNYCCPSNYRRILADLPGMIYYRAGRTIAVNLYTPSTARVTVENDTSVVLRQETDYPSADRVLISVNPMRPARFKIRLRIPGWCGQARVTVDGQPAKGEPAAGEFFEIDREWRPGTQIALELPMAWRFIAGRKKQEGRVAVMRGPVVYCLNPQRNNGMGADAFGRIVLDPSSALDPVRDDATRPGGTSCRIRAWSAGRDLAQPTDLQVELTEFPDPDGRATYFRLPDSRVAVADELLLRKWRGPRDDPPVQGTGPLLKNIYAIP